MSMSTSEEPAIAVSFKSWLAEHGGAFNPLARFIQVPSGLTIIAREDLFQDSIIVECPFDLAITAESSQKALLQFMNLYDLASMKEWPDRQWICLYLCFHWIIEDPSKLPHYAYVKTLPSSHQLRTPLHFTPLEMQMFEGTNLYHATLDREQEWKNEWKQCQAVVAEINSEWGTKLFWKSYLTVATYVSSRAFPSSLLSLNPSLLSSSSTKPVLLPGIDSLNHARKQPVSWIVTSPSSSNSGVDAMKVSLVIHTPIAQGQELLNNYGAKPNSEFILGYGFSLPDNPDDTIVLKVGGINGKKWEVGRSARGVDGLWDEIIGSMKQNSGSFTVYEDHLDAAGILIDMVQTLLDRLPREEDHRRAEMRPEVALMLHDYVEGQRDILESIIAFAEGKGQSAIEAARLEGIEIVLED